MYLIKIVTTVPISMSISIGKGDETQTTTAWSFTPIDANSNTGSYTFEYLVVENTAASTLVDPVYVSAPAWLVYGTDTITINDAYPPTVGTTTYYLKGTAYDETLTLLVDSYSATGFEVTVYTLTVAAISDYTIGVDQGSYGISSSAWTDY